MKRTRAESRRAKRDNVEQCESEGTVADSHDVRLSLMEQVHSGEKALAEVQSELRDIQRNAQKSGMITRNQAFKQG